MPIRQILQKDISPELSSVSEPVESEEFNSSELNGWINDMKDTLDSTPDGVALAAPQIGIMKRIFVVSKKIVTEGKIELDTFVFINPEIINHSKGFVTFDEGCLSVDGWYGKIDRHEKVKIRAYKQDGQEFERGASGLLAEIFQHEIDHLDGILFTNTARDLKRVQRDEEES